ncbi:MAG: YggS family pyridoxal phosphate-dependent enzyme [Candidatus Poribacteria bacterium]|nr:YggS family pyridoxal phosphate-dependent enzyme [Candidatus Poribacteria bacterium]
MTNRDEPLVERLTEIRGRIADAARRAGRSPDEITLIAVSKTMPVNLIAEALDAGVTDLGENRVQEGEEKIPALPNRATWHLIGHLQSNKAKRAVELFEWIQSVDSLKLLQRLDRIATELGKRPRLLLQVNATGNPNQSGVSPTDVTSFIAAASEYTSVSVEGLMAIAPFTTDDSQLRRAFASVRELADRHHSTDIGSTQLRHLSMGMTGDFEISIEEGATMVRIGSAIFGARDA